MRARIVRLAAASTLALALAAGTVTVALGSSDQAHDPQSALVGVSSADLEENPSGDAAPTEPPPTDPPIEPPPSDPPTEPPPSDPPTDGPPTEAPGHGPPMDPPGHGPPMDPPGHGPPTDPPGDSAGEAAPTEPPPSDPPIDAEPTEPPVDAEPTEPPVEAAPSEPPPTEPPPTEPPPTEPTPTDPPAAPIEPTPTEPPLSEPAIDAERPSGDAVEPASSDPEASVATPSPVRSSRRTSAAASPAPPPARPAVRPLYEGIMGEFVPAHVAVLDTAATGLAAGIAAANRAPASVAVALEFGRASGGWAAGIVFNLWLRRQLRARRISQRQLAALAGVDHSTISRLLRRNTSPSLTTATKIVRALRHASGEPAEADTAEYFDRIPEETVFPARRVELALRADDLLDEEQVRNVMMAYLEARRRDRGSARSTMEQSRAGPPRAAHDRQR